MDVDRKGRYKTRLNTLKLTLLSAVHVILAPLFHKDEQVVHVAAATAYYPIELIFGNGWSTMLYNRCSLVPSNQRHVALNFKFHVEQSNALPVPLPLLKTIVT